MFQRSHNDDLDEPDDTGYPDTLDISTEPWPSYIFRRGTGRYIYAPQGDLVTWKGNSGSEKATQGRSKPGGTKDDDVRTIPCAPVLDEFLRKPCGGRPPEDPRLDSNLRGGDVNIVDEFSSQPARRTGCPARKRQNASCLNMWANLWHDPVIKAITWYRVSNFDKNWIITSFLGLDQKNRENGQSLKYEWMKLQK